MSVIYGKPVNVGGGSKIPQNLPPLNPNFKLEFSGTTVTITANKLPKNDNTAMLAGGVWVLDSKMPESPKGAIVKQWTAAELIDTTQTEESKETVTWTYTNWTKGEPVYCRQYTYNPKGQYNTTVMGGVASTLDKPPFMLPVFTGNHAIFGDETAGRIELYESGTLTLSPGTYDFFLVGGGGGGGGYRDTKNSKTYGAGGGGSGYTKTEKDVKLGKVENIEILIGAGGSYGNIGVHASPGSKTSMKYSTGTAVEANGGNGATGTSERDGGAGGSGGGGSGTNTTNGGNGGSDGSDGKPTSGSGTNGSAGVGQHTTTRLFGDPASTLYAGGGGGYVYPTDKYGNGGAGGGGHGASKYDNPRFYATAGSPNTGGGGGGGYNDYISADRDHDYAQAASGGSGIVVVRWGSN